ncbi:MAG: polyphosphate kinase 2 [Gammaproteobacteria bacterium]|nr:polyphosphate kinase 2 [Gammaproteobacteria bacterium]
MAKHQVQSKIHKGKRLSKTEYERELLKLQAELTYMLEWIITQEKKVVVVFEGRDAAGKGSCIKRITQYLRPRYTRVVALPAPNDEERSQWYFQRYIEHLPAAGELVIFDRSWYNRAGVEHVMGFCTDEEYEEFFHTVPEFERMLVRSGVQLIKYWFSVSDAVQEKRFQARLTQPHKSWKLSTMDLQSRTRWVDYSKAKDTMLERTSIPEAPWYVVNGDVKVHARLNCISHLLSLIEYERVDRPKLVLPPRPKGESYTRPPFESQNLIPEIYP